VPDSDETRELEPDIMRLTSGCIPMARSGLGAVLTSEMLRLTGGRPADLEARQKFELACLRMAADCMQLVGDIQNPNSQRDLLELAKQLTAAAEATEVGALT
jgi:phage FluMu protein gp41